MIATGAVARAIAAVAALLSALALAGCGGGGDSKSVDRAEAAANARAYLDARAAGHWATACAQLYDPPGRSSPPL